MTSQRVTLARIDGLESAVMNDNNIGGIFGYLGGPAGTLGGAAGGAVVSSLTGGLSGGVAGSLRAWLDW